MSIKFSNCRSCRSSKIVLTIVCVWAFVMGWFLGDYMSDGCILASAIFASMSAFTALLGMCIVMSNKPCKNGNVKRKTRHKDR